MRNPPIGLFDSGIGGLTVLKAMRSLMPGEDIVYFADTANLPYGTKSPDQIKGYARKTLRWMQDDIGVKMGIAACNTSSALALDTITPEFHIPLIGTITPMILAVQNLMIADPRIGILATPASVASSAHERALRASGFSGVIMPISCPEFVPLIEANQLLSPPLKACAHEYLKPFLEKNLNTLIYGCTHYPFLDPLLKTLLPSSTTFIDPAESMAQAAYETLKTKRDLSDHKTGTVTFYTSAAPQDFAAKLSRLMPEFKINLKSNLFLTK
jgi:glutamate racemase